MIKKFHCGLCEYKTHRARHDLRKHLRDEHKIRKRKTNFKDRKGIKVNQDWWRWEEFK